MNNNFLIIIKRIIAEQGEGILGEPGRLKGYVKDYAKNEPKPLRVAFGRCIENGAYNALKIAQDKAAVKAAIAQRVNSSEGLDLALCNEALDVLEAALFGRVSSLPPALQYRQPVRQQPQTAYVPPSVPQNQPPVYIQPVVYVQQNQSAPQHAVKKGGLWTAVLVLNILGFNWVSRFITGHIGTGILVLLLDIISLGTLEIGIGIAGILVGLIIWIVDLVKIGGKKWQMADGTYLAP
ncbi:hypothetical protein FACS1894109_09270 [Spirochaetia bacterium]|nr:hypothetical protein FACS1894109_09270 [Spirochaetia bacterium]